MFSVLFHKDIFMPEGIQEKCKELQSNLKEFIYSKHLKEHLQKQMIEDRSHKYLSTIINRCLSTLSSNPQEVFEVEYSKDYHFFRKGGWFVTKYCCRIPYDKNQDIVIVLSPIYKPDCNDFTGSVSLVKTIWMNEKTDLHTITLEREHYTNKNRWEEVSR